MYKKENDNGYAPKEIAQKFNKKISDGLEDLRKDKMRIPTPPKYVAFGGSGMRLGG
jgi:hypothetical protein